MSELHFEAYFAIYGPRSMRSIRAQHSDMSHLKDNHLSAKSPFHNFLRTHAHPSQNCGFRLLLLRATQRGKGGAPTLTEKGQLSGLGRDY